MCTCFISFLLSGVNKTLRAIAFFQFFDPVGKFVSFQLHLSMKGLIFDILSGYFFMVQCSCYYQLKTLFIMGLWVYCVFLFSNIQENISQIHHA